jgi:hypothetical protein
MGWVGGHLVISFSLTLGGLLEDHAVTVFTPTEMPGQSVVGHHVRGLLLALCICATLLVIY